MISFANEHVQHVSERKNKYDHNDLSVVHTELITA